MSLTGTIRIPAHDAVVALFQSHLLEDHLARTEVERMARSAKEGAAARRAAFDSANPLVAGAIRDRIAYSQKSDDLYAKPALLEAAIATLRAIATAAGGEADRLEGEAAARAVPGQSPDPETGRALAAVRALQREAGVLMALAQGARLAAATRKSH